MTLNLPSGTLSARPLPNSNHAAGSDEGFASDELLHEPVAAAALASCVMEDAPMPMQQPALQFDEACIDNNAGLA